MYSNFSNYYSIIASEQETETSTHRSNFKQQQQQTSLVTESASKSSSGNLFSHLKTKASRTKFFPSSTNSTTSQSSDLPQSTMSDCNAITSNGQRRSSPSSRLPNTSPNVDDNNNKKNADHLESNCTSKDPSKLSISLDCPTMWFGTDDSIIYIYSCFDAVRYKLN